MYISCPAFDTFIRHAVDGGLECKVGIRGGGVASVGRADEGTTSRLQRDGEHFDNPDVYVLDM